METAKNWGSSAAIFAASSVFSNPGYQWLNFSLNSSLSTFVRTCKRRWAPFGHHRICCFLTNIPLELLALVLLGVLLTNMWRQMKGLTTDPGDPNLMVNCRIFGIIHGRILSQSLRLPRFSTASIFLQAVSSVTWGSAADTIRLTDGVMLHGF